MAKEGGRDELPFIVLQKRERLYKEEREVDRRRDCRRGGGTVEGEGDRKRERW